MLRTQSSSVFFFFFALDLPWFWFHDFFILIFAHIYEKSQVVWVDDEPSFVSFVYNWQTHPLRGRGIVDEGEVES